MSGEDTRQEVGSTMAKTTFGKKLRECREDKDLSQQELAKILKTSHSVIGRYERDEMSPSIDAVKKWRLYLIPLLVIYWVRVQKEKL
jgi:transcriptional regulator with XRE-family HTH domain